jgi:glutamate-1-semialdehyde 2,1-aminomutase
MIPLLEKKGIAYQINRLGSMMSVHFTDSPVVDFTSAAKGNNESFKKYFHGMLAQGVYLPPSPFESYFLNDAISQNDLDKTLEAFTKTLTRL